MSSPPPIQGTPLAFRECHLAYALRPVAAVLDDQVEHLQPFGMRAANPLPRIPNALGAPGFGGV